MQLQTANRKKVKIKMALQGPAGSGKTKSALLIAYGLCGAWNKIAVIDTENRSAELYSDLGDYLTLQLSPPFTPEKYIQAIQLCIKAGMEVIIIDSATHEWDNLLEYHSSLVGNSFTNWGKVTPRHDAFVNTILQAPCHIICTIRSKIDYVLNEKNGKTIPEKVGMKGVQRENLEYEFTIVLELDMTNKAKASKDRTALFAGKPEFVPSILTGTLILDWCNQGKEASISPSELLTQIHTCQNSDELLSLYNRYPSLQEELLPEFTKRRQDLLNLINHTQNTTNGISTH